MSQTMRGMRIGGQSLESEVGVRFSERGDHFFICPSNHESKIVFSADAEIPNTWDCKVCGVPAIRHIDGVEVKIEALAQDGPRTHFEMLMERRTSEELETLLAERLDILRAKRARGEADL